MVKEERRKDLLLRALVVTEAAIEADTIKEQEELNKWAQEKASQERVIAAVFADRAACNALAAAKRAAALAIKSHRTLVQIFKDDAATRISIWYRQRRARKRADAMQHSRQQSAIIIQTLIRSAKLHQAYLSKRKRHLAAICIQKQLRKVAARWFVYEPRKILHQTQCVDSAIKIQTLVRGFRSRRHFSILRAATQSQQSSAKLVQSRARGYLARRSYAATRSAIILQRVHRGRCGRKEAIAKKKSKNDDIVLIQCSIRRFVARCKLSCRVQQLWELRERSAIQIQSNWRRIFASRYADAIRAEWQAIAEAQAADNEEAWRVWGASIIQAWWRDLVNRTAAANEEAWRQWGACVLQAWYRRLDYKWQLRRQREEQREFERQVYEAEQAAALGRAPPENNDDDEDEDAGIEEDDDEPFEFNPDDRRHVHEAFQWVRHRRRDKLKKFCQAGFDPDLRNEYGQSLAMVAAQNNSKVMLKTLFRHGVHINEVDYRGNTALHYACQFGYMKLAAYMVRKLGADDSITNNQGKSCYLTVRRHSASIPSNSDDYPPE
eukprot:CAMPEP_0197319816 /NCGR_PEP_ID=MMETSP0891-20130614/56481_1 /TAXON_ID=44058 ORGANISM="Aureoumbra lagunensis, Strain CCMP1510" /NCGR_SAMPLE_ID=MMETSP0891 /ASSEMBLY_ACC=CAM_ASM_000534 /LENGTH=549 /DNA_ID=CAMNT_0042810949 /DNA_START=123 /DNA_END=1772 /DNA_ORIENTATION=+